MIAIVSLVPVKVSAEGSGAVMTDEEVDEGGLLSSAESVVDVGSCVEPAAEERRREESLFAVGRRASSEARSERAGADRMG
jgi:hypothetical protein